LCLILDNDLYAAVGDGRADGATTPSTHHGSGIVLKSGRPCRQADVIVTAPACSLQGGWAGVVVEHRRRRGQAAGPVRLQGAHARDIPNMAWCVGYINAS
jgi:cation diffusion facilitator CzcD-associated flavoprotein CzcO